MELRPYQKECIKTVNELPDGSKSVAVLATGLGKTVIAAHFDFHGRMLWLSHRDELVRQPEKYFTEQGYTFGIEKAGEQEHGEDVVSASVQSLYRDARLNRFAKDAFDIIILDEAQHAAAPTYLKILNYFKPRKLIGLTATPRRGDRVRLTDAFNDICFVRDLRWGIENGYLSRIRCVRVDADFDMDLVEKGLGDFTADSLQNQMVKSNNDIVVAKAYKEYCLPKRKKTLIYCPTIKICETVAMTIKGTLPASEQGTIAVLTDKISAEERRNILDKYRSGEIRCIVNCMILTEGTDLPDTSVIINDRPSSNDTLYQQIVGRGTRLYEGKEYCLIIDVLGTNSRAKNICMAPTLFGIDPFMLPAQIREKLQEGDLLEIAAAITDERAKAVEQVELKSYMIDIFTQERLDIIKGSKTFHEIAGKYQKLAEDMEGEEDFGDIAVKRMPDTERYYCIPATYTGCIYFSKPDIIGNTTVTFDSVETVFDKSNPISMISDPIPFDEALSFVGDFLKYAVPPEFSRRWSKKAREIMSCLKATDKQLQYVRMEVGEHGGKAGELSSINRLEASDIIDMSVDIKKMEKAKDKLDSEAKDREKKRSGKSLEKWLKKKEKEERAAQKADREKRLFYKNKIKNIRERVQLIKERQLKEEKRAEAMIGKTISFKLPMNSGFFCRTLKPSDKQLAFINSLVRQAKLKGGIFDIEPDPIALRLDMWHCGFLINYLLFINDNVARDGFQMEYKLKDYIDEIGKIINPVTCPGNIECKASVLSRNKDN